MPPEENAELDPALFFLASKLSIPCPKAYTFYSPAPIVFTVGSGRSYSVVISSGALGILDEKEMKAVLTCEAAKIATGSVPVNTVVGLIAGSIISLSTIAMWMSMFAGFGQEKDSVPRLSRFIAMGLVSLPAALLVHLFSVNNISISDATAARMIANPRYLTGSFSRINNHIRLHCRQEFNPGHVNLFLLSPLKVNSIFDVYFSMFMTKPDFRQRVRTIEQICKESSING